MTRINLMNVTTASAIVVLALVSDSRAQAFFIDWHTIGGSGSSAGGGFTVRGIIGQPDAGEMSGGGFILTGGFWAAAQAGTPALGDCDADGDIDLDDHADFTTCSDGPGGGLAGGCECADFDGDGDADLMDWAEFQIAFGGP